MVLGAVKFWNRSSYRGYHTPQGVAFFFTDATDAPMQSFIDKGLRSIAPMRYRCGTDGVLIDIGTSCFDVGITQSF